MLDRKLIGLTENFGKVAFQRIVDAGIEVSPIFDRKVAELIQKHRLRRNPWEPAANFLRDEILPIMDKNNELECYMMMYLIRHLGAGASTEYQKGSTWKQYENKESPFGRIHQLYRGHFETVIRGLLARDGVQGTSFEKYLQYPLDILRINPEAEHSKKLFAITYELDPT